MPVVPSTGFDPLWFSQSILKENELSKNLPELIQRVQKFERLSVPLMVADCLWFAWHKDNTDSGLNRILKSHALFIAALAFAKCELKKNTPLNEASLRILCGEIFNHHPTGDGKAEFTDQDHAAMKTAVDKHKKDTPLFSKLDFEKQKYFFNLILTLSRHALVQWEGYIFDRNDLIRQVLINDIFNKTVLSKKYCTQNELERATSTFLGTNVHRFVRAIWFMHTLADNDTKDKGNIRGFPTKSSLLDEETSKVLDLTNGDLDVVANRLSIRASQIKIDLAEVQNETSGVHNPKLWILYDFPFIHLDDMEDSDKYLPISPWRALRKMNTLISHDLINYLESNNILNKQNRAYQTRGDAYEAYLHENLSQFGLNKVNIHPPSGKKICDFIWEDSNTRIFVEAKVRLRPNSDPSFLNAGSLITSIASTCEAITQTAETIALLPKSDKKTGLIIVTDEYIAEQVTQFVRSAKFWKLLEGTSIDYAFVCPTSHLEYIVVNKQPSNTYEAIKNVWNKLDPIDFQNGQIYDYDFFNPDHEVSQPDFLMNAWEKIIPGFKERSKALTEKKET